MFRIDPFDHQTGAQGKLTRITDKIEQHLFHRRLELVEGKTGALQDGIDIFRIVFAEALEFQFQQIFNRD